MYRRNNRARPCERSGSLYSGNGSVDCYPGSGPMAVTSPGNGRSSSNDRTQGRQGLTCVQRGSQCRPAWLDQRKVPRRIPAWLLRLPRPKLLARLFPSPWEVHSSGRPSSRVRRAGRAACAHSNWIAFPREHCLRLGRKVRVICLHNECSSCRFSRMFCTRPR
jgi:hypothetical protein